MPQRPRGGSPPIVWYRNEPSAARLIRSMAPGAARMPCLTPEPSNAGPALLEAQAIHSRDPRTTSPLVPMSIRSLRPGASYSRVARTPATMSLPTYAPTAGRTYSRPRLLMRMPASAARMGGTQAAVGMYGARRMRRGSRFSRKWIIAVLPEQTTAEMHPRPIPRRSTSVWMRSLTSCTMRRCISSKASCCSA